MSSWSPAWPSSCLAQSVSRAGARLVRWICSAQCVHWAVRCLGIQNSAVYNTEQYIIAQYYIRLNLDVSVSNTEQQYDSSVYDTELSHNQLFSEGEREKLNSSYEIIPWQIVLPFCCCIFACEFFRTAHKTTIMCILCFQSQISYKIEKAQEKSTPGGRRFKCKQCGYVFKNENCAAAQ